MNIYPSILTDSTHIVAEQLERVRAIEEVETVQIDIIDGEFADNLTISAIDLIAMDFGDLNVDFHLMVNEPVEYVYECKQIDNARAVIGQIERMTSQEEFITEVLELNLKPGLSLDIYTPVDSIKEESWERLSIIQIMGNHAGIQGQPFKADIALKKIKEVAEIKKKLNLHNLEILVDIGVNEQTIASIAKAGATGVAPGSALWKSEDVAETIHRMQSLTE
jgi:ribulose-phosphate 3-epimerase